jgi:hypothetical protein
MLAKNLKEKGRTNHPTELADVSQKGLSELNDFAHMLSGLQ